MKIACLMKLLERESELATIRATLRRGGLIVIEGGAGVGKTAILDAAGGTAVQKGRLVIRARGSDLEHDFAFGVVRRLLERYCADAPADKRAALFRGPAHTVTALLLSEGSGQTERDTSFAVVHGLYWLTLNLAARRPILIAIGARCSSTIPSDDSPCCRPTAAVSPT
jgi:hypothetical protein